MRRVSGKCFNFGTYTLLRVRGTDRLRLLQTQPFRLMSKCMYDTNVMSVVLPTGSSARAQIPRLSSYSLDAARSAISSAGDPASSTYLRRTKRDLLSLSIKRMAENAVRSTQTHTHNCAFRSGFVITVGL